MNNNNKIKIFQNLALVSQIGIMMIVPIAIGLFIGKFLDEKLGTGYVFLFIFLVIGVGAAFVNLYKIGMRDQNKK
ncbi:MAG: AtpZ/AtpI family protein [Methanobacterium sp.]|nr:AtpZ/AtpI family protein [Methanobacterium sp.]MBV1759045.1 AtpZ/AtpI family protein [Dethiosulfatibacter sp.]